MRPDGKRVPEPGPPVERILPSHILQGALNLVVFGPGKGEAIVVVLPDGMVGVVDGCREPTRDSGKGLGDPVREFLSEMEHAAAVRGESFELGFVCLTHPHEDHFAGMGHLLRAYRGKVRHVWCVPQVGDRYAEALLRYSARSRGGRDPVPDDADVKALERVIVEISEAHERQGSEFRHLGQQRILYEGRAGRRKLVVSACGPADVDIQNALHALVEGIDTLASDEDLRVRFDPNAISGVLHIRWGSRVGVLLGGDLICASGRYQGWELVEQHVRGPMQVVKAAHHASHEAHHDGLWKRLSAPLVIVTPFKNADAHQPPRPEQIAHLAKNAVVAITAPPRWPKDSANPQPLYAPARTPPTRSLLPKGRNSNLSLGGTPGEADTLNAIAVAIDAHGRLQRFVLAGKANVYEPPLVKPASLSSGCAL